MLFRSWVTPLDGKDGSPLALYLAMSADGATFSARTRVPTRGPAAHVQVVAEPAGSLVAAWEENVGGTRRVAFARVTVDTAGKVSVSPLRVGVDEAGRGYPVVASTGNGVVAAWVKQEESGTTIGVARAR